MAADLQTERYTRYWLVWSSSESTSIRIDPPTQADYYHTEQITVNNGRGLAAQCRDDAGEVVVRVANYGGTQPLYVQVLLDDVLQDADAIPKQDAKQIRISGISNGDHIVTVIDPFDTVRELPFTVDCQPGDFERNSELPKVADDSAFNVGRPAPAWHPGYCGSPSYVVYVATSTSTEIAYSGSDGSIVFGRGNSPCTSVPVDGVGSVEVDTNVGWYYWIGFEGAGQAELTINPSNLPTIEVSPSGDLAVDCAQDGGQITFTVTEVSDSSAPYTVLIALDGSTTEEFIPIPGTPRSVTVSDITDGPHTVAVSTPYQEFLYEFDVDCAPEAETIQFVTSCAAGNVRVDVIIVNEADASKVYFADFEHSTDFGADVSLRKSVLVGAYGQGRISITGRPSYQTIAVTVTTGGEVVAESTTFGECDVQLPLTDEHDIVVTSSCLAGNGLIRYVIVNPSEFSRVWRIGFGDLRLRTTSADGRAAGYGGISGRPDGDFPMRILFSNDVIWEGTVTVDCDS